MMRGFLGLLLLATATQAIAAPPTVPPRNGRPSVGVYVKSMGPDGQPRYRYVYRGYEAGMPSPAWLYYGYPHAETPAGRGF
jgi:hypothetical protein